uniref:Autophagy-related protein 9 n=1 Tax=Romanomermis culicivorax TaxID=13658 RepID=A0A915JM73_ROMCU
NFSVKGLYDDERTRSWYSPWQDYWRLKDEYKNPELIDQVSLKMENTVFYLAIINLLFSPIIFLWQIFYSLFSYGELVKREPGLLGVRRWSIYGKYFLRHFNELDHELEYRLNMAYKPACQYLNMFRGNMLEILAQNLIFFLGAYVIVIIALSLYDQDVLLVQNVLTILTLSSLAIAVCRSFISNENQVFCPELMLKILTTHLHYIPDFWKNRAHTSDVRRQFAQLFQFTATFVLEELFSPVLTPFILLFWLKPKCREFLEFFRRFTIEVPSLGDVCSFAMLDIRKHGDKNWQPAIETDKSIEQPDDSMIANLGKTELSLIHFQLVNPNWSAPPVSRRFLTSIREQCQHDLDEASSTTAAPLDEEALVNPLVQSLASLPMPYYTGLSEKGAKNESGNGLVLSLLKKHQSQQQQMTTSSSIILNFDQQKPFTNDQLLMSSLMISSNSGANTLAGNYFSIRNNEMEMEMSVTAAYLRELRDRKVCPRLRDYGSMQFSRAATSTAYKTKNENQMTYDH